ncbi:MAG TPA: gluconokinase [Acidimicrobiales bacterium]|nr:gluconokinase [Acidimicrobiales bacterium]
MSGPNSSAIPIVVMGVSGSGKTHIGKDIARRWRYVFIEADDLHSARAIEKMASGHPLGDDDRLPWLRRVGERIREEVELGRPNVTACSALKRAYRDLLREYAPDAFFLLLDGPIEVVRPHVETRQHSFMPASLLESQYETLETLESDESGIAVDLSLKPKVIARTLAAALEKS